MTLGICNHVLDGAPLTVRKSVKGVKGDKRVGMKGDVNKRRGSEGQSDLSNSFFVYLWMLCSRQPTLPIPCN